ncbi:unnamed protein product (macronuclear) [Paramecium tetraurelia]|uniref:Uncharacterized protein n=1 Tax=Paramecium tetraurelia TaxID=5888 RepID=A0BTT7_PARTE|nr:uncharacterized protein GSPATT00032186001 [Paramecium tetraurelia]CAK61954.1 unnamed protein product [Paramecium tetraurelia]|eukprot:XP_001429352.1 hypothetical protein (macronuclear) [Paramecium tetraurelia strain d4-2]
MQNLKFINNELESQLKASHLETRQLKQEIIKINQLNAQLKEQLHQITINSEIEDQYKQSLIENKMLKKELEFYQLQEQSKVDQIASKPSYEQLEKELNDLQIFFKKYYNLQETLLNKIPIQLLKDCWLAINQTFKSHFNIHQTIQNIQEEVSLLEQDYKQILHANKDNDSEIQYLAKQNIIVERRVEIEKCRKEIQIKQFETKKMEQELDELQKEFDYICKIEQRRFNQQIEIEKQLVQVRQKTTQPVVEQKTSVLPVQRSRQHSDYFRPNQISIDSQQSIKPLILRAPKHSAVQQEAEKTNLEKTIDQTRQKLSRQLSLASNLRESTK